MRKKFFLTVFNEFGAVLARKDVGAIPYYLSLFRGWESGVMYFSDIGNPPPETYSSRVKLLRMGGWFSTGTFKYFFLNSGKIDVLNIYHGAARGLFLAFLYKLFNPGGIVYCKLDMAHLDEEIINAGRGGFRLLPFRIKEFLKTLFSSFVDFFTIETLEIYGKIKDFKKYQGKLYYLPNGFYYDKKTDIKEIVARKKKNIVYVGRIGAYEKNTELFIEAISKMGSEAVSNWNFQLVGEPTGEFLKYYKSITDHSSWLSKAVTFMGQIKNEEELFKIYSEARYICLTSRWESFGFAVLEAMYFGCIPVVTSLPAMKDLTENGRTGYLFSSEDLDSLSAILAKVTNDGAFDEVAALKANEIVSEKYNWEKICSDLDKILKKYGK